MESRKSMLIFLLWLMLMSCKDSDPPPAPPKSLPYFELKGVQGAMHMVFLKPGHEKDRDGIVRISESICESKRVCIVLFWINETFIPRRLPMSDAQNNAMVAHYVHNRNTAYKRLLLHCRLDPDPTLCFQ